MLDERHRKNIRVVNLDKDAKIIHGIYARAVEDTHSTMEEVPPTLQEMTDRIATTMKTFPWIVYEKDGELLGFAYGTPHRSRKGYQWTTEAGIYVTQSAHRQGIGKALYEVLFEILIKQGYFTILGGVNLPNEGSCKLHLATGFEFIGVYKNVGNKFGKWWNTNWYQKELQPYLANPKLPIPFSEMKI